MTSIPTSYSQLAGTGLWKFLTSMLAAVQQ
ncbi:hypothetical protein A6R68_13756 [Neotoma lepida]|uniref:Uncharacterized protein n=1 Tax=Neotoma lepida TaxID=56216 RepID=A0A1A6H218_NEOLE|nr:hypothetical protein A6R68_13756 [Neotoma lepida]